MLKCRPHAVIGLKVHVSLDHSVSLRFISLSVLLTLLVALQAKNNTRSAPASTEVTKSHTEAIMHILQIITYATVEKGMEHRGEQR